MKGLPDLSHDVLDRARLNRDARFDGRFIVAISNRGTYCRSICPIAPSNQSEAAIC
jgi:AraC family transcriptional regulator of adaptative response / DNA-3-methyladenine glycosylase II